jgi:hypothetical protein
MGYLYRLRSICKIVLGFKGTACNYIICISCGLFYMSIYGFDEPVFTPNMIDLLT